MKEILIDIACVLYFLDILVYDSVPFEFKYNWFKKRNWFLLIMPGVEVYLFIKSKIDHDGKDSK